VNFSNTIQLSPNLHDQIMKRRDKDKQLSAQKTKDKKQEPD
jgi:hypothetical protein